MLWMTKQGGTQKIPTVLCRTSYTHIDYSIHQIIHSSHACKVELLVYVSILPAWGSLKSATNFLTTTAQFKFLSNSVQFYRARILGISRIMQKFVSSCGKISKRRYQNP